MSDHLLFLVGVVDTEFRTPREKAQPVVRCLEDELAPYRDARPRCIDCGVCFPARPKDAACKACLRDRQLRAKATDRKKRQHDERAEWVIEQRLAADGWICCMRNNAHILQRLVQAGRARWMTAAEQQRAGLQRFDAVAVPANRG